MERGNLVGKIGLRMLVLLGGFLFFTMQAAWAAETKPILFSDEKAAVGSAMIEGRDIYLPAPLLREAVYQNTEIDRKEKQFFVRTPLPRFALPQQELHALLQKRTSLFALPLKIFAGAAYVEADAAAKLLGFTWRETAEAVVLRRNAYGSFAPRVLPTVKAGEQQPGEKLSLVWQPVFTAEADLSLLEKQEGLDIISPSWLEIAAPDGRIRNRIDGAYVRRAKEKGYRVWALITNQFDPALTSKVLRDERARENVVKQLATYAALYELDGINLDFENIYDADKDRLSVFVAEIATALRKLQVKVSMDVTAPSNISQWSASYDRAALGAAVDYLVIMAYDEHWRTSPVSGSVASIGWVERSVVNTLKEVPAEKIILGVPFYMREWEEKAGQKTGVRTMTMHEAKAVIAERNLTPMWLEEQGQYYFSYEKDGKTYRVWQEEERSLARKLALVEKYGLAGAAAWRKGFEDPTAWPVMQRHLKGAQGEAEVPQKKAPQKDLKQKKKKEKREKRQLD